MLHLCSHGCALPPCLAAEPTWCKHELLGGARRAATLSTLVKAAHDRCLDDFMAALDALHHGRFPLSRLSTVLASKAMHLDALNLSHLVDHLFTMLESMDGRIKLSYGFFAA